MKRKQFYVIQLCSIILMNFVISFAFRSEMYGLVVVTMVLTYFVQRYFWRDVEDKLDDERATLIQLKSSTLTIGLSYVLFAVAMGAIIILTTAGYISGYEDVQNTLAVVFIVISLLLGVSKFYYRRKYGG